MQGQDDGFRAIWLYWMRKYKRRKAESSNSSGQSLSDLKRQYSIEAVDSQLVLDNKIAFIREQKGNVKWPLYVIDPEKELAEMERVLSEEGQSFRQELYSYYLNIRNVFIIYSNDWEGSENLSSLGGGSGEDNHRDNVSQGPKHRLFLSRIRDNRTQGNKSRPDLSSSLILKGSSFKSNESEYQMETFSQAPHHKIEDLQVIDCLARVQGLQVWNCKYKHIPHSYLKMNDTWKKCVTLRLSHPCQPKLITNQPITYKLGPLRPGNDKLMPFLSYLKILDKYFPNLTPHLHAIFEANGLPVVFTTQDDGSWSDETNLGLMCYCVVNGYNDSLTAVKVEKWAQRNAKTQLGGVIKDMNKRQREKNKLKREVESKGLLLLDQDSQQIW